MSEHDRAFMEDLREFLQLRHDRRGPADFVADLRSEGLDIVRGPQENDRLHQRTGAFLRDANAVYGYLNDLRASGFQLRNREDRSVGEKAPEPTVEQELCRAYEGFTDGTHCMVQFRSPVLLASLNPDYPAPGELWNISPAYALVPQTNEAGDVVKNPITGEPLTEPRGFPPVPVICCTVRIKGQMLELEYLPRADGPKIRKLVHPSDVMAVDRVFGGELVTG